MNKKLASALNFLGRNHTRIIVAELAVTTVYAAMMIQDKEEYEKFLADSDKLVDYYTYPDET